MPIYAYKCESCGFAKDVLQKMSDTPLTDCPSCGASAFKKQVTAAGFQLKGSGWYATDFKGGGAPTTSVPSTSADTASKGTESKSADSVKPSESSASKSDSSTPSASGGCGGSCACH